MRSTVGMPGSETANEEIICRVLGDSFQDGTVTNLADDLYCSGNTIDELFFNWEHVLQALKKCNSHL